MAGAIPSYSVPHIASMRYFPREGQRFLFPPRAFRISFRIWAADPRPLNIPREPFVVVLRMQLWLRQPGCEPAQSHPCLTLFNHVLHRPTLFNGIKVKFLGSRRDIDCDHPGLDSSTRSLSTLLLDRIEIDYSFASLLTPAIHSISTSVPNGNSFTDTQVRA